MDYIVNEVWRTQRPLRTDRILSERDRAALHRDGRGDGGDRRSHRPARRRARSAPRCSRRRGCRGCPARRCAFRGRTLFDATIAEAIPVHVPRKTATDMLVLQTRPQGISHTPLSGGVANLTDRYLMKFNPALVELRRTRSARYDALIGELAAPVA